MAKQNRTTLKGYFETGDIPSQEQYADLIDSKLNLSDSETQILEGGLSASFLKAENNLIAGTHITASGNISGSESSTFVIGGTITAGAATFTTVDTGQGANELFDMNQNVLTTSDVEFNNISSSANISASGGTGSFGSLQVDGSSLDFTNLPTSDPGVAGRLYNDSGTVKISAG
jgi:hypothetical protein